ncbi:YihY/virulence factor BrkB family protein [Streptomyces kanamyceticus]|uniref:YihY/virulence factor BrkB family protein n=1 Tax=Streptomyces kanamyceticus TaxID=1967 RepID=A0A5J6GBB2_STRKN|nr:YihY/virulence factor BrkB family protein [Streptomyces kanamyceticus]QEU92297.1 YihY/virulence factor BrkB family protein [Streptomyces kanamyceticus]
MDWLKKLPVIGPLVERAMRTHAWHAYERLDRVHWARLAAAMTFISFLALFPLLTVAAAVAAATLSKQQQDKLQDKISEQVPGIADQLNLDALVANAGTIGLVAGALLLFTGIGWVGSIRECLRAVWELADEEENPVLRKVKDAGVLIGLGGAGLASVAASGLASTAVGRTADFLGIDEQGWGALLLRILAFAIAVLAAFLLLLYVLTLLPGVQPERRDLFIAGLIGAAGFELLKLLLGGYMKGVAAKSMYGAFGVPVALLLWINFTAKLLLFCAAWTATRRASHKEGAETEEAASVETASEGTASEEAGVRRAERGDRPGPAAAADA